MTLQRKVLAVCLPAAAAAVALSAWLSSYALRRALLRELVDTGQAQLRELAPAAERGLSLRSERDLIPVLRAGIDTLDADAIWVLDPAGTVVAHTDVTRRGARLTDPWVAEALLAGERAWRVVEADRPRLEVFSPVGSGDQDAFLLSGPGASPGRPVGWLAASLPLARARAAERRAAAQLAAIVGGCVGVSLGVVSFVMGNLLEPVRRLAQAVVRVRQGEYGTQVPAGSSDEVGELARRFNQMSAELERTVVSKARIEEVGDFLDSVIEAIPLTVFVKDAQTLRYVRLNAAGERLLGRPRGDLVGKTDAEFFPAELARRFTELDRAVLERDGILEVPEETVLTASGPRLLHTLGTVVRGRDGRPRFILGISADVTDAKRAAETLRQAEKLSAVGALAAGIAHEVNNPLAVILGFAKAARRRLAAGDELDLPLASIEREAQRCLRLVRDLLTFSRRRPLATEEFDLNEAIGSTRSMLEAHARAKGVELSTQLAVSARVVGDRDELEQVVLNLFNNAVDASPEGGRVVLRTAADAREVRLEVEDRGPGIPRDIRDRVFEPFFTTKEAGKGTGLGLSLVHEIVARHRGRVEISDARPSGALMRVFLPKAAAS